MDLEKIEFKQLFNILKNNPETFLLRNDIVLLHQFLMGALKINTNQKDKQLYSLFSWNNFHFYEQAYLKEIGLLNQIKYSAAWSEELKSVCNSEEESIDLFFHILDQFVKDFYEGLVPDEAFLVPISERSEKNIGRYLWPEDMENGKEGLHK